MFVYLKFLNAFHNYLIACDHQECEERLRQVALEVCKEIVEAPRQSGDYQRLALIFDELDDKLSDILSKLRVMKTTREYFTKLVDQIRDVPNTDNMDDFHVLNFALNILKQFDLCYLTTKIDQKKQELMSKSEGTTNIKEQSELVGTLLGILKQELKKALKHEEVIEENLSTIDYQLRTIKQKMSPKKCDETVQLMKEKHQQWKQAHELQDDFFASWIQELEADDKTELEGARVEVLEAARVEANKLNCALALELAIFRLKCARGFFILGLIVGAFALTLAPIFGPLAISLLALATTSLFISSVYYGSYLKSQLELPVVLPQVKTKPIPNRCLINYLTCLS